MWCGRSSSSVARGLEGVYNVAGDGRLPWSEVPGHRRPTARSCSAPSATGLAAAPLARLGVVNLPPETLDLLRFGRGVDNRKLKRGRVRVPLHHRRRRPPLRRGPSGSDRVVGETEPTYRYERDVESFFRHSSAVVRPS